MSPERCPSPLEDWSGAFASDGITFLVKRDDLLPFPLAGNKYRKLRAELADVDPSRHLIITVGAVNSNHCRTAAMMAARAGVPIHLVLHGDASADSSSAMARHLYAAVGARYSIVSPDEIAATIDAMVESSRQQGREPHIIAGGCHTPAGVRAYTEAVAELAAQLDAPPDIIVHASGTGATQAGIVLGCRQQRWSTQVVGVSVARGVERGRAAVLEAIRWLDPLFSDDIHFDTDYIAGGYGKSDAVIDAAVAKGWSQGLPLDPVYTGKAFAATLDILANAAAGQRIVFWHTGGLFQFLTTV